MKYFRNVVEMTILWLDGIFIGIFCLSVSMSGWSWIEETQHQIKYGRAMTGSALGFIFAFLFLVVVLPSFGIWTLFCLAKLIHALRKNLRLYFFPRHRTLFYVPVIIGFFIILATLLGYGKQIPIEI